MAGFPRGGASRTAVDGIPERKVVEMKSRLLPVFAGCLSLAFGLIFAGNACAGWSATVYAEGQDLGGTRNYEVVIGVGASAVKEAAPPAPPEYSVKMAVYARDWSGPYLKDIRQGREDAYLWIVAINPHGNIMPPIDRASTMSWDPSEFGAGDYELRAGFDGMGDLVVADMRIATSYEVTGGDTDQYFTIGFTPGAVECEDGYVLWSPSGNDSWVNLGLGTDALQPGIDYTIQLDLLGDPLTSVTGGTGSGFFFGGAPDGSPGIQYAVDPDDYPGEVRIARTDQDLVTEGVYAGEGRISLRVSRTGHIRTLEYTTPGSHAALAEPWNTLYTQNLAADGLDADTGWLYMYVWAGGSSATPGWRFDRITITVDGDTSIWDGPDSPFEQVEPWGDFRVVGLIQCGAPWISLLGDAEVTARVGDTYNDAGAKARDDADGDLTDSIVVGGDVVDTTTAGIYTITYDVSNSHGYAAKQVTRTVVVRPGVPDPWSATIHAEGQDLGGVEAYEVMIGVDLSAVTIGAPPAPPEYSVKMATYAPDWSGPYLIDIRQKGEAGYLWIVAVNPHGNMMPQDDRSSTLSWNPSEFGTGHYELRAGSDGKGDLVVADMKTTTSYQVTGGDAYQYFTIGFTPGTAECDDGFVIWGSADGWFNLGVGDDQLAAGVDYMLQLDLFGDPLTSFTGGTGTGFYFGGAPNSADVIAYQIDPADRPGEVILSGAGMPETDVGEGPISLKVQREGQIITYSYTIPGSNPELPQSWNVMRQLDLAAAGGMDAEPGDFYMYMWFGDATPTPGWRFNRITNIVDGTTTVWDGPDSPYEQVQNWGAERGVVGLIHCGAPWIMLLGDAEVRVGVGDTYNDAGAEARDDADGDLTGSIVVGGDVVDTTTAGIYTITYNVSDSDGHAAEGATRTVVVEDLADTNADTDADTHVEAGWADDDPAVGTDTDADIDTGTYMGQGAHTGTDMFGFIQDADGVPLANAIAIAYDPLDPEQRHEAMTDAYGFYTITLPSGASLSGWTVVASIEGHTSERLDNQAAGTVDFTAGQGAKLAIESVTASEVQGGIRLDISGDPPFGTAEDATVTLPDGLELPTELTGEIVSAVCPALEDFSVLITTDTSSLRFFYVYEDRDLATKRGEIDAGGGTVHLDLTTAGGQQAIVEVPAGGLAGEDVTIEIKQVPKTEETVQNGGSPLFVYEVTAVDDITGEALSQDQVNRVEITLPIDLTVISQGELDDGTFVIYQAESRIEIGQPGGGVPVPLDRILGTDYTGDGVVGSVTFWVDHLSVFAVGVSSDDEAPVIALVGESTVDLVVGDTYTDGGATAADNADGDITADIVAVSDVDTDTAGTYAVTYSVSDAAGNAAAQVTRTVTVTDPSSSGATLIDRATDRSSCFVNAITIRPGE